MKDNKYINLNRAVIEVNGADTYKFLQGIITNDLGKANEKNSIYSYLLTPQGKYLFDFFISKNAEKFIIDIAESDKDDFIKKLKLYKLRSQVEINESQDLKVFGVIGKNIGIKDPRNENLPNRLISNKNEIAETKSILEYHKLRVENNVPEGIYDLEKEKSYPLQYRMIELNGVDFKKGCYVGQEVTARTHHRGVIRKTVYKISAEKDLTKYGEIKFENNIVGKVLTSVKNMAIAIIETEFVELQKDGFTINGNRIRLHA